MPVVTHLLTRAFDGLLKTSKQMKASQFAALPAAHVDALFVGDSITDAGEWGEWFPELRVANRGIGGDRTQDVLDRIDTLGRGQTVSLMIGTNDLGWGRKPAAIAEDFRTIVERILADSPSSTLLLNSVLPRTKAFATEILKLNEHYGAISESVGATYVDLWPRFSNPDRTLRRDLTSDNLHLNGAGYLEWADILRPLILRSL